VTPVDIQRVAAQYFAKTNRTVGVLVKTESDIIMAGGPSNEVTR
jgi:predicted Zn-dependent peptidase